MRTRRLVSTLLLGAAAWFAVATSADGARNATTAERIAMGRAIATAPSAVRSAVVVTKTGRMSVREYGVLESRRVVAVRSQVDPNWALVGLINPRRADQYYVYLLQRRSARWTVVWRAYRGDQGDEVCRVPRPGAAVLLELGLPLDGPGIRDSSFRCRYPRKRQTLVRPMTPDELASVRQRMEYRWDDPGVPPARPMEPELEDVSGSDCSWDSFSEYVNPAAGEVARIDPRWGLVTVNCVVGTDGFGGLGAETVYLVHRAGRTGPFTRVVAHTGAHYSMWGELQKSDRRWPMSAAVRAALQFGVPFPAALGHLGR